MSLLFIFIIALVIIAVLSFVFWVITLIPRFIRVLIFSLILALMIYFLGHVVIKCNTGGDIDDTKTEEHIEI